MLAIPVTGVTDQGTVVLLRVSRIGGEHGIRLTDHDLVRTTNRVRCLFYVQDPPVRWDTVLRFFKLPKTTPLAKLLHWGLLWGFVFTSSAETVQWYMYREHTPELVAVVLPNDSVPCQTCGSTATNTLRCGHFYCSECLRRCLLAWRGGACPECGNAVDNFPYYFTTWGSFMDSYEAVPEQ